MGDWPAILVGEGCLCRFLPRRGYTPRPRVAHGPWEKECSKHSTPKGLYNPFGVRIRRRPFSQVRCADPGLWGPG